VSTIGRRRPCANSLPEARDRSGTVGGYASSGRFYTFVPEHPTAVVKTMARNMRRYGPVAALAIGMLLALQSIPARADTTVVPEDHRNNGFRIYLSPSCHNDERPCVTNPGCNDYTENASTLNRVREITRNEESLPDLIDRGYTVRIGRGGYVENRKSSNAWFSHVHIPVHTNAHADPVTREFNPALCDDSGTPRGTQVFHWDENDRQLAQLIFKEFAPSSPGAGSTEYLDQRAEHELTATHMPAAYLELEYHTWNRGVQWLRNGFAASSWLIARGIDQCLGFPRQNANGKHVRTAPPQCTWAGSK